MPELPEVESIARRLQYAIQGREILNGKVLWAKTVHGLSVNAFLDSVQGTIVKHVGRRGKYIIITLAPALYWLVHLRMSGKFTVVDTQANDAPPHKHCRASFDLDQGLRLDYVDMRKFGRFYLVPDPDLVTGHLGIEPLDEAFTATYLHHALANRSGEIKRLLLNQEFIAGIGNIYASEALWLAGIHPRRSGNSLSEQEAGNLRDAIVDTLATAIDHGGTSLDDRQYVYPDGGIGGHQKHLRVYDRAGDACPRCGYPVERVVLGQRSTYYCPVCQRNQDET